MTSATVPVVGGLVLGVTVAMIGRSAAEGVVGAVVFALVMGFLNVTRVRRRLLTVRDDALVVQRDQYRLVVPWSGITAIQQRRHQRVMQVEELVCTGGTVEAIDSRGHARPLPGGLADHPALSRVMVSLYARDWRRGPIGEKVRALGIEN